MARVNKIEIVINATDKATSILGGVGKGLKSLGKVAATAGIAAVGAVAGVGVALGKLAVDAAPLEGIGIAFDKMSKRVGLSLDDLKKASAGTISDFELMRKANIALTGAGEDLGREFGKAMPRLLEAARAAAKATGQDVDFLFESLVTGVKRGSPMLIDNTGLVVKLGEANEAMAAKLGKAVKDLTAEEKSIALLNATLEAGSQMVEEFGGGQLTAAEQMAQFRATLQNTKDQIGLAMLPALRALMKPLGELAGQVGPKVVKWAQVLGQWLAKKIPIAVDWLQKAFSKLGRGINGFVKGMKEGLFIALENLFFELGIKVPSVFWNVLNTISKVTKKVISWFGILAQWLAKKIPIAIEFFKNAFQAIVGVISNIITWLQAFVKYIIFTIQEGDALNDWLTHLPEVFQPIAKAIGDIITWIQAFIKYIKFTIQEGDALNDWLTHLPEALQPIALAFGNIIVWIQENWPQIKEIILGALQTTIAWIQENWPQIRDTVMGALQTAITWIRENWPAIKDAVLGALQTAWTWIRENWPTIKETVLGALRTAITWVRENWPVIRDTVLNAVEAIRSWFAENWPIIAGIFLTAWEFIKAVALSVVEVFRTQVIPPFQEAFANLTEAMNKLGIDWGDVWNAIWQAIKIVAIAIGAIILALIAIITGIISAVAAVAEKVTGAWVLIIDAFQTASDAIAKIISGAMNIWHGIFSGNLDQIVKGFEEFGGGIKGILEALSKAGQAIWDMTLGALVAGTSAFVNSIIGFFTTLKTTLVGGSIVQDMMDMMIGIISDGVSAILTAFTGLVSDIIGAFSTLGSSIAELVGGALDGIVGIVEERLSGIIDSILGVIADAITAAEAVLGMGSPSRVFQGIGQSINEGLAMGIAGSAGLPVAAAIGVAQGVTRSVTNNFNLTVNTRAETSAVIQDFRMLQALEAPI